MRKGSIDGKAAGPRLWSAPVLGSLLALTALLAPIGVSAKSATPVGPSAPEEKVRPQAADPVTPDAVQRDSRRPSAKREPGDSTSSTPGIQLTPEEGIELGLRAIRRGDAGSFGLPSVWSLGQLGLGVKEPSPTLVDQLDLPKGQGLAVEQVETDSAAAKAGLRAHDILLEVDGQPVPDDVAKFAGLIDDIKLRKPVDVVVLRKGKRETMKGLSLPESQRRPGLSDPLVAPALPINVLAVPPLPLQPNPDILNGMVPGNGVLTTSFRSEDRFTTRHQEGSLVITVTGRVTGGQTKVGTITVRDGLASHEYESLEKVSERYQDKVKNLVEMSEKSAVKVEIKKP